MKAWLAGFKDDPLDKLGVTFADTRAQAKYNVWLSAKYVLSPDISITEMYACRAPEFDDWQEGSRYTFLNQEYARLVMERDKKKSKEPAIYKREPK